LRKYELFPKEKQVQKGAFKAHFSVYASRFTVQGHAIKKHLMPENYALEMCAFQSQFVRPGENYGLRDDVDDIRY
jgi:hypothetical protein